MKRPLLPVALLYIVGILCGDHLHLALPALFAASFLVAAMALALARDRAWLCGLLVLLVGWTGQSWHSAVIAPDDLRAQLGQSAEDVRLRGVLQTPPVQRIYERGGLDISHSTTMVEANEIFIHDAWQPAYGKVIATVKGVLSSNFYEGQRVEISGVIQRPDGPLAQGLFDPRDYYEREDIFYQLRASSTNDFTLASSSERPPISTRFRRWAMKTLAIGMPVEDEPLRLIWTLMLDWKTPNWTDVEEPFMQAGTYHIFAVDGLRIGLLAAICLGLLRLAQIPRALCGAIVLPVLWFYVGLTGWPASAVRSAIMTSVIIAGWALQRPGDLINSLCAAALIILIWQPGQLFQPGFQLSFLVVACIAVIVPPVNDWLTRKLFTGDPMLPDTLQPRWPPLLLVPARYLVETFSLSVAAWIGSLPLAAYYFHLFTLASIPANCVVVPATALALFSGMGSLLTGAWWPGLAALFNNASWALMKFIIWFSGWAANWPSSHLNAAAPSFAVCAFYYAAVFMIVTGWIFRVRHKWIVTGAMLAVAAGLAFHWANGRKIIHLHVLPLGGAPAIFVDSSTSQKSLLIDCGDTNSAGLILKPFLAAQGVNRLSSLCLAVGLLPYFGGANTILDNFAVNQIFIGNAPNRSMNYRELVDKLHPILLYDGENAGTWADLHPGATDAFARADDNSVVLRGECNGHSVLVLPALGREGQDALMRRHPELRAEIVIAGLPTRDEPLCDPLLEMLQARLIIVADAEFPATRRASQKLRERLVRQAAQVFYCRDNGALTLDISRNDYAVHTATGGSPKSFQ